MSGSLSIVADLLKGKKKKRKKVKFPHRQEDLVFIRQISESEVSTPTEYFEAPAINTDHIDMRGLFKKTGKTPTTKDWTLRNHPLYHELICESSLSGLRETVIDDIISEQGEDPGGMFEDLSERGVDSMTDSFRGSAGDEMSEGEEDMFEPLPHDDELGDCLGLEQSKDVSDVPEHPGDEESEDSTIAHQLDFQEGPPAAEEEEETVELPGVADQESVEVSILELIDPVTREKIVSLIEEVKEEVEVEPTNDEVEVEPTNEEVDQGVLCYSSDFWSSKESSSSTGRYHVACSPFARPCSSMSLMSDELLSSTQVLARQRFIGDELEMMKNEESTSDQEYNEKAQSNEESNEVRAQLGRNGLNNFIIDSSDTTPENGTQSVGTKEVLSTPTIDHEGEFSTDKEELGRVASLSESWMTIETTSCTGTETLSESKNDISENLQTNNSSTPVDVNSCILDEQDQAQRENWSADVNLSTGEVPQWEAEEVNLQIQTSSQEVHLQTQTSSDTSVSLVDSLELIKQQLHQRGLELGVLADRPDALSIPAEPAYGPIVRVESIQETSPLLIDDLWSEDEHVEAVSADTSCVSLCSKHSPTESSGSPIPPSPRHLAGPCHICQSVETLGNPVLLLASRSVQTEALFVSDVPMPPPVLLPCEGDGVSPASSPQGDQVSPASSPEVWYDPELCISGDDAETSISRTTTSYNGYTSTGTSTDSDFSAVELQHLSKLFEDALNKLEVEEDECENVPQLPDEMVPEEVNDNHGQDEESIDQQKPHSSTDKDEGSEADRTMIIKQSESERTDSSIDRIIRQLEGNLCLEVRPSDIQFEYYDYNINNEESDAESITSGIGSCYSDTTPELGAGDGEIEARIEGEIEARIEAVIVVTRRRSPGGEGIPDWEVVESADDEELTPSSTPLNEDLDTPRASPIQSLDPSVSSSIQPEDLIDLTSETEIESPLALQSSDSTTGDRRLRGFCGYCLACFRKPKSGKKSYKDGVGADKYTEAEDPALQKEEGGSGGSLSESWELASCTCESALTVRSEDDLSPMILASLIDDEEAEVIVCPSAPSLEVETEMTDSDSYTYKTVSYKSVSSCQCDSSLEDNIKELAHQLVNECLQNVQLYQSDSEKCEEVAVELEDQNENEDFEEAVEQLSDWDPYEDSSTYEEVVTDDDDLEMSIKELLAWQMVDEVLLVRNRHSLSESDEISENDPQFQDCTDEAEFHYNAAQRGLKAIRSSLEDGPIVSNLEPPYPIRPGKSTPITIKPVLNFHPWARELLSDSEFQYIRDILENWGDYDVQFDD